MAVLVRLDSSHIFSAPSRSICGIQQNPVKISFLRNRYGLGYFCKICYFVPPVQSNLAPPDARRLGAARISCSTRLKLNSFLSVPYQIIHGRPNGARSTETDMAGFSMGIQRREARSTAPAGINLAVVPIEDKPVLENFLSYYMHDLSEFADRLDPSPDGRFRYDGLEMYFTDKALHPLFICHGNDLAGFVLLNQPPFVSPGTDFCINEFFILRKYRGRGLGRAAASTLLKQYPGRYLVIQLLRNVPAIGFWHSLYRHLDIDFDERRQLAHGEKVLAQRFTV